MTCIHRVEGPCIQCALLTDARLPMSPERQSIAEYLDWAASFQLGSVLSDDERQGVRYAAAWVRNHLDERAR